MEAANSSNPMMDVASIPGDYGPPRREDEGWIRMRLGFLEEQVGFHPRDARLLRRLASSYTALYSVISPGGEPRLLRPDLSASMVSDPRECCDPEFLADADDVTAAPVFSGSRM